MVDDIAHEATYPHPPEKVWKALTTPEAVGAWLMENTMREATPGHRFEFRDKPKPVVGWDGRTACEILEVDPPRRLVIRFGDGTGGFPVTRLVFDLQPTPEGGTRLRFRHEGFTGFKGWLMRKGMDQGWRGIVRYAIPLVVADLDRGATPVRESVRAEAKRARRAEHAARRAQP